MNRRSTLAFALVVLVAATTATPAGGAVTPAAQSPTAGGGASTAATPSPIAGAQFRTAAEAPGNSTVGSLDGPRRPSEPNLELIVPEPTVTPGRTQQLTIQILNDGEGPNDRVRNATSVEVEVGSEGPIESESGPRLVGRLVEGVPAAVTVAVSVDADAAPGRHRVPVRVTYEFRNASGRLERNQVVLDAYVEVPRRARFEVVSTSGDVAVGETGTLAVTVRNAGSADATDAVLALSTSSPAVTFGRSSSASRFVGTWEAGETRTLRYEVSVAPGAERRRYALRGQVNYESADGRPRQSRPLRLGVRPGGGRSFAVEDVETTLRVGERGTVRGVVVNRGDRPVEDAVVVVESATPTVTPVEAEYAVGTLDPGERANFSLEATVDPAAAPGPRQLTFRLAFVADGRRRASDPLTARVRVRPARSFALAGVETDLVVGEQGSIRGRIRNAGNESVANAVVVLAGTTPTVTPVEAEYAVGTLDPGETANFSLAALVEPSAEPGMRQFTLRVQYRDSRGRTRASDPLDVRARVQPGASFRLTGVETTLRVGEQGTITGTVVNEGERPVEDAVVTLAGAAPSLVPLEPEYAVGTLDPGESATFRLEAQMKPTASAGPRRLTFRVGYRSDTDQPRTSDPLDARVTVGGERTFAVENVRSTLRVGSEGTVSGVVVNTGERTVENVVVAFAGESPTLSPREPEFAVGTLDPGERATFSFDVAVSETAAAGPRQLTLRARYRSEEGEPRASDPLDVRVSVGESRPTFRVEVVEATYSRGASGDLVVRVTNRGNETLRNVGAKLFADDPISATDDEAFVETLAPNESVTLTFGVGVGGGALEKTYPVEVDFRYEEPDGDTKLSDTYQVPVRVEAGPGGGGGPLGVGWPVTVGIALGLVITLVIAGLLVRRRGGGG